MPLQPGDLVVPQVFADDENVFFHSNMRSMVGVPRAVGSLIMSYSDYNPNYFSLNGFSWPEHALIPIHPQGAVTTFAPGDKVIPIDFSSDERLCDTVGFNAGMKACVGVPCEVTEVAQCVGVPVVIILFPGGGDDSCYWPVEKVCAVKRASAPVIPAVPPQPKYAANDLVELMDGTWMRVVSFSAGAYKLLDLSYGDPYHPESDIAGCVWPSNLNQSTVTIIAPLPDDPNANYPVGDTVTVITRPTENKGVWCVGVRSSNNGVYDLYAPVECLSGFTPTTREVEPQTLFDAYAALQVEMDQLKAKRRADLRARAKVKLMKRMRGWVPPGMTRAIQWLYGPYSESVNREMKERGELIGMYITAVRRYPERMDVLGECIMNNFGRHESIDLIHNKIGKFAGKRPEFIATAVFLQRPELVAQVVHISEDDPLKIAYYPSIAYMKADRCIRTTVGRYLQKFCSVEAFAKIGMPGGMTELEIKRVAERHRIQHGPVEVKWAYTREECIRVVAEGPTESCMANGYHNGRDAYDWFDGHIHPAAVYGTSDTHPDVDTAIAYLEDADGVVVARVICNKNTKECARGYGDHQRLIKALAEAGWHQCHGALVGAQLAFIKDKGDSDRTILPYVDAGTESGGGYLYVRRSGNYLIADTGGYSTYNGYEKNGSVRFDGDDDDDDSPVCDVCGSLHDEDDSRWSAYHSRVICDSCIEDYEFAYVGRREQDWVESDLCYEYDGDYYTDRGMEAHNLGTDDDGSIYPADELCSTPSGVWHQDSCVKLDVPAEGGDYEYAHEDDVVTTHDGRTIYDQEATTHHWHDGNDYVLHDDDDPEDYLPEEETIELAA